MSGAAANLCAVIEQGTILDGRYVVEELVPRGGAGIVYAARRLDGERVSLTELPPVDAEAFRQEADALAAVDVAGVLRVREAFAVGGQAFLVHDWIEGPTLEALVGGTEGFLPMVAVARLFRRLCDVLSECHHQVPPLLVRQLRPDTVVVDPQGELHVTAGLACVASNTPFSPIEQWVPGRFVDHRSDIYALGGTLYAMLTRRTPPTAVELATGEVPLGLVERFNPLAGAGYSELIARMMRVAPMDRLQTVTEVRDAFEASVGGGEAPAADDADVIGAWRRTRRCPGCGAEGQRGLEVCPQCGQYLKRRMVSLKDPQKAGGTTPLETLPAPPPLARAEEEDWREIPEELLPQPPRVRALVQVPQGFLEALTSKAAVHEMVEVEDVNSQAMLFDGTNEYATGSTLLVRLVVPLLAGADYRIIDAKVVVKDSLPAGPHTRRYLGVFKGLKPDAAELLDTYKAQERRQAQRFERTFQVISRELPDFKVLTTDVSAKGLSFLASSSLPVGTELDVLLDPDDATMPQVPVRVRVVSSRPTRDENLHRIGVAFEYVGEKSVGVLRRFLRMTAAEQAGT